MLFRKINAWFIFALLFSGMPAFAANNPNVSPSVIPKVRVKSAFAMHRKVPTIAHIEVITAKEIQQSGAQTIEQILQGQGGVELHNTLGDGNHVAVSLRGFGSNAASNSLILINGIPYANPDLAAPNLNLVPVQDIKAIVIIPSSQGVLYGDQAVGGVIDIITRQPTHKFSSQAAVSYGSYQHRIFQGNIGKRFANGFGMRVTAYKSHTDNYRRHNTADHANVGLHLSYHYHSGSVTAAYRFLQQHLLFAGALTATQVRQNRRQAQNNTNFSDNQSHYFYLKQQQTLNKNWRLASNFSYRYLDAHGFLFAPFMQQRNVVYFAPHVIGLIHHVLVNLGLVYGHDQFALGSPLDRSRDRQNRGAIYAKATLPIYHHLDLILGGRTAILINHLNLMTSSMNTNNKAWATTVGLAWQITHALRYYIRRDSNFRFPKADEITFVPLGQIGLKTQTGVSYETGVGYHTQQYKVHMEFYVLDIKNEIAFDPTQLPTQPFGANRNLAPTRRIGFILGGQVKLWHYLTLGSQYNFVDARFRQGRFRGKHIPLVAMNVVHAYMNLKFYQYWNLYVDSTYYSSQFAANDFNNVSTKFAPYVLLNSALQFHYKGFSAIFRVNNLLDKHYNAFASFNPTARMNFFYPAPGRNFLLTLSYQFI